MTERVSLRECGVNTGKKTRLHRLLHNFGSRNGTALFLPYDQGLEHGPRDFFANPFSSDPKYIIRLAIEGGFNGGDIFVGPAFTAVAIPDIHDHFVSRVQREP